MATVDRRSCPKLTGGERSEKCRERYLPLKIEIAVSKIEIATVPIWLEHKLHIISPPSNIFLAKLL